MNTHNDKVKSESGVVILTEDYWLDNLRDGRNHITLREFLNTIGTKEEKQKAKELILAHAKELMHMYEVPGARPPIFPEPWHGRWGLLHHAKMRWLWLANREPYERFIDACYDKWCALNWRARHQARDWRETKYLEQEATMWYSRRGELINEVYGLHYETPECLI